MPAVLEGFSDSLFEWGVFFSVPNIWRVKDAGPGVLHVLVQDVDPSGVQFGGIHIFIGEVGKKLGALACSADEDVQAAVPAFSVVYGPEGVQEASAVVEAVADADHDHVSFITLDVLEVLNEERFGLVVFEGIERLELWVITPESFYLKFNGIGLRDAEGSYP